MCELENNLDIGRNMSLFWTQKKISSKYTYVLSDKYFVHSIIISQMDVIYKDQFLL
jgi:hypothetical protein